MQLHDILLYLSLEKNDRFDKIQVTFNEIDTYKIWQLIVLSYLMNEDPCSLSTQIVHPLHNFGLIEKKNHGSH